MSSAAVRTREVKTKRRRVSWEVSVLDVLYSWRVDCIDEKDGCLVPFTRLSQIHFVQNLKYRFPFGKASDNIRRVTAKSCNDSAVLVRVDFFRIDFVQIKC